MQDIRTPSTLSLIHIYQVVTYDTAEEAQKECDKINSEGKKTAYTRGNALLIGEKDYEHHDEYSKPFQEYKK